MARKKLLLFPPAQLFSTNIVSVAAGGITAASFAAGALDGVWTVTARALTDKVGFALTAGSYSVRASSSQRATANLAAGAFTANITIAAVTTTRASQAGSSRADSASAGIVECTTLITSATTIEAQRDNNVAVQAVAAAEAWELF